MQGLRDLRRGLERPGALTLGRAGGFKEKESIMRKAVVALVAFVAFAAAAETAEIHVAVNGKDANPGTPATPLRTIQRAAEMARPCDVVTVHAGVYRERISPQRGGESPGSGPLSLKVWKAGRRS